VLSVVFAGCYVAHDDSNTPKSVAADTQDLVGGFSANDPALNAVGSLMIRYRDWGDSQLCTAVLVQDNMAITAKHCVEVFDQSLGSDATVVFAIGPDGFAPTRVVEVVDYEKGPISTGGYVDRGHDVGVLHLGERITDITPLPYHKITDAAVGLKFTGIGYGEQDSNGSFGTRKLGTLTLKARKGKTLEIMAGSFAHYFELVAEQPLPESCSYDDEDAGVSPPLLDAGLIPPPRGGSGGFGGEGSEDPLCSYAEELRERYDSQFLEAMTEVVVGGAPGDSQPCYGDSGGPLLRKRNDGTLSVWGVTSGIIGVQSGRCHPYGSVYAALDTTVTDFFDKAKEWVDPCDGLSAAGRCSGAVAERCTTIAEGKRRRLAFDCASVDLTCERQTDGSIGCGSDAEYFPPAPEVVTTTRITRESIARKMDGPRISPRE
jgi:V8-like Glu-specific endopeptidase